MVYNGNLKGVHPPFHVPIFLNLYRHDSVSRGGDVPCTSHICHTLRLDALQGVLNAQKRRCRHLWESSCEPPQGVGPADPAPVASAAASATLSLEECLDREVPSLCFREEKKKHRWENKLGGETIFMNNSGIYVCTIILILYYLNLLYIM